MEPHTYSNEGGTWLVEDLWRASEGIDPVLVPLRDIIDMGELLDSHTWAAGPLSVREILGHVDRIENADLSYPIILTPEGWIGDGCHRLIKAWRLGLDAVPVVRLPAMPSPLVNEGRYADEDEAGRGKVAEGKGDRQGAGSCQGV